MGKAVECGMECATKAQMNDEPIIGRENEKKMCYGKEFPSNPTERLLTNIHIHKLVLKNLNFINFF